jgi:superfamily II DNA or RNA helicase
MLLADQRVQVRGDDWEVRPVTYKNGDFGFMETARRLSRIPERNALILALVRDALRQGRRKVLVFSIFVEHVEDLAALVRAFVDREAVVVMHGQMAAGALDAAKVRAKEARTRVLLTTYNKLAKGWDDPDIDAEILALPKSDVQQVVGRAEREAKGKMVPLVVDLVDEYPLYHGMGRSRRKFYAKRSFDMVYATASDLRALMDRREGGELDQAQPLCEALEYAAPAAPRAGGSGGAAGAL